MTSEKWFDVEIDAEQNERLLKDMTTKFIVRFWEQKSWSLVWIKQFIHDNESI